MTYAVATTLYGSHRLFVSALWGTVSCKAFRRTNSATASAGTDSGVSKRSSCTPYSCRHLQFVKIKNFSRRICYHPPLCLTRGCLLIGAASRACLFFGCACAVRVSVCARESLALFPPTQPGLLLARWPGRNYKPAQEGKATMVRVRSAGGMLFVRVCLSEGPPTIAYCSPSPFQDIRLNR